jgi:hypothetical protein
MQSAYPRLQEGAVIRPLRSAHRLLVTLLAVAVPAMLIIVLMHRQLPAANMRESGPALPSIRIATQAGGKRILDIGLPADTPEVLAYWVAPGHATVDASAVLLGRLDRERSSLELPMGFQDGQIALYSLPLNRILAQQTLHAEGAQ